MAQLHEPVPVGISNGQKINFQIFTQKRTFAIIKDVYLLEIINCQQNI